MKASLEDRVKNSLKEIVLDIHFVLKPYLADLNYIRAFYDFTNYDFFLNPNKDSNSRSQFKNVITRSIRK